MTGMKGSRLMSRRSLLAATLIGAGGLLAACAPAPSPTSTPVPAQPVGAPGPTPTVAPVAQPATSSEPITIRVFNRGTPTNETPKGAADEYMAAHPNVTVQWESAPPGEDLRKMLVQAAAGTPPDVQWQCLVCNFMQYVLAGLSLDLNPLVKSANYNLDQHLPSAVTSGTREGKLYGMPQAFHPSYPAVIINKTMFEEGGVPIPKEDWTAGPHPGWTDWTFDAMQQAAIALTKREGDRVTQWGFQMQGAANPFWVLIAAIRAEGGDYLNAEGTNFQMDSPEGVKVVGFYGDLYTKHKVAPLVADMPSGGPDLMASKRVAIRSAPIWAIRNAQTTFKDFEWQILPAPRGQAGVDGFAEVNFFSINKATQHPETAFGVLALITDPKWAWQSVEMGGIPGSQKEFWDSPRLTDDPNYAIFSRMAKTVSPAVMPANGRIAELANNFNSETEPLWIGQPVDGAELIQQVAPKLQAIVASPAPPLADLAR